MDDADGPNHSTGVRLMKANVLLVVTSLLSILLMSLHIAEDIVLGFSGGGLSNLLAIGIPSSICAAHCSGATAGGV